MAAPGSLYLDDISQEVEFSVLNHPLQSPFHALLNACDANTFVFEKDKMNQYKKFQALHHQKTPLLIANAWNVKSAQVIEKSGYEAIATSSGAIANSLGYDDGEKIPFNELLYIVQRIRSSTTIPLSVDFETGYTNDLTQLNNNIQQLIDNGVAGINIEDAQGEEIYLKKLDSIKNHLAQTNQQLFINARTDGFLQKINAPLESTLRRAELYRNAGADGLFVTGVQDPLIIKEITSSTTLPVNIVCHPKLATVDALSGCGVRRISMAVFLYRSTYSQLEKISMKVKTEGSFASFF